MFPHCRVAVVSHGGRLPAADLAWLQSGACSEQPCGKQISTGRWDEAL